MKERKTKFVCYTALSKYIASIFTIRNNTKKIERNLSVVVVSYRHRIFMKEI